MDDSLGTVQFRSEYEEGSDSEGSAGLRSEGAGSGVHRRRLPFAESTTGADLI